MSGIRTSTAAAILGVSASTLRSWERRFGFPEPLRSAGGHRRFARSEIESLRWALAETHSISAAIALVSLGGGVHATGSSLVGAMSELDEERSYDVLEESLAARSVERTIDEVLLPALAVLAAPGRITAELDFARRLAARWLAAQHRLVRAESKSPKSQTVLIVEASAPGALDAARVQALELVLARGGVCPLTVSMGVERASLARVVRRSKPCALVLAAPGSSLDALGRFVYAARAGGPPLALFDFGGGLPGEGRDGTALPIGPGVADAARAVLAGGPSAARAAV